MQELLPDGGSVRKLWLGENDIYAEHLLRLDPESRRRRFSGAVSDDLVRAHAATARGIGVIIHGFFVEGMLRGSAELRVGDPPFTREAEAAFSIEQPWQSHGVGSALLERTLLSARNRRVTSLHMHCLADNQRMRELAQKFDAELTFDFGSVTGELDPPRSTALSLMREMMADGHGIANAILDAQSRMVKPV
ncbi:MAG: GNAT family N-acetyltransferase [Pseudolabrys sp.]